LDSMPSVPCPILANGRIAVGHSLQFTSTVKPVDRILPRTAPSLMALSRGDIRIGQMTESTNPDCLPWNKPLMPSSLPAQYHSLRASLARRTDQPAQERDLYDEEMEISPVKDANGDVVRYIAIKRM
jgi:hypothetical protein